MGRNTGAKVRCGYCQELAVVLGGGFMDAYCIIKTN